MKLLKGIIYHIRACLYFFKASIYSLIYFKTFKVYLCNHLTIGLNELIKRRVKFPHPIGVVIGKGVKLGFDCIIYQNVTIGTKDIKNGYDAKYPIIGDNVVICANTVVFGDIEIGDNCIIGAASVVTKSFPNNCIIAGNPAKIIKFIDEVN